jgi:diguanylate cyclase (GGDEF)-like protein/PAS domain S-box-containing protein
MNRIECLQAELQDAKTRIAELESSATDNLLFLSIFNSSPVPFCVNDEFGNILQLNTAFTKIFGYDMDDIPNVDDWWPKAYPDPIYRDWVAKTWQERFEKARETQTDFEPYDVNICCKNGTQRTAIAGVTPLALSQERLFLVILYDVTEIKQAKNEIGSLSSSLADINTSFAQQNRELIREKENAIASEERLRYAMEGANDGLWDWDLANDKIYFSPRWKSMLGYEEHELEDHFLTWRGLLHPDDVDFAIAAIDAFFDKKVEKYEVEFRMQHKHKHYVNVLSRAFAIESEEGKITRLVGTHVDITERKKAEAKLLYLSSHDSLTGLVNRREFEQRAARLLSTPRTEHQNHAMCYLDLDQFKVVNDTCGHAAGDELLRQLSHTLKKHIRQADTFARLGGDEFGVLMENCTFDEAKRITLLIQNTIQEYQFSWDSFSFRIGASIGLVQIKGDTLDLTELLKNADVACYMAKDKGRNRIHVHCEDDAELAKRQGELKWVSRIQHALDAGSFCLYAQAIESLGKDHRGHYEVLVRMIDEYGVIIPPGAFLPAAERYNLIGKLDRWVVQNAVELLEKHPKFFTDINFISINLSGQSITDESFLSFIVNLFERLESSGTKICFEITETAAISNLTLASNFISELRQYGCRFALDDFGSGLSSFAYLKNLSVDYLKIDGTFVKDIVVDRIDHAMVKSINEIGQVMGMKTIAEFVENVQIKDMLKEIGVDYVQGYGIHKPQALFELIQEASFRNKLDV